MDAGLLALRLAIGLLIAGHGVQKVSFRLGGKGLDGGAAEFRADGFRGGRLTALAAGGSQIAGGLLVTTGALTPLAAAASVGVMTVAVSVKRRNGLWVQNDGYEYPLLLALAPAALSLTGPGRWSVDHVLGLTPWSGWWTAAATLVGLAGGLLTRFMLTSGHAEQPVPPR
ncbi:DoxX family protein [Streptomyces sp. NPDC054783]